MLELQTENREVFGKKLKDFRKIGKLAAVLYGPKEKSRSLFVSLKDFKKLWQEAGESTVIQLKLTSDVKKSSTPDVVKEVLIHDVALDPVKNEPVHVDFYAVQMDKPIQAAVSLEFSGISPAVKNLGGILVKVAHEVEVEALPKNLPHELSVNVSVLADFGDKIFAKDITLPDGVHLVTGPEEVIALMEAPKEEAAPAEEKIAFDEIEVAVKKEKEEGRGEETKEEEKKS